MNISTWYSGSPKPNSMFDAYVSRSSQFFPQAKTDTRCVHVNAMMQFTLRDWFPVMVKEQEKIVARCDHTDFA